jgi:ribosome biogenesis GTPase
LTKVDPSQENRSEEEAEEVELPQSERIRRAHEDRTRERRKTTKHRERISGKNTSTLALSEGHLQGRIVRSEGQFFIAELTDSTELRVKAGKRTIPADQNATLVTVGDRVLIDPSTTGIPLIAEVLHRKTKLLRRASGRSDDYAQVIVANIDTLVIVVSILEPPIRSGIIDRYIVAGLDGKVDVAIVINKTDLITEPAIQAELDYFLKLYSRIGYPIFALTANDSETLTPLHQFLSGTTSVFAGHSGVGKSSLVNVLLGTDDERTGELSKKFRRGAHTTSRSVLLKLGDISDTYVVDTPGVREFANHAIESTQLKFLFVEFRTLADQCAITNCSHIHEPGCAVIAASESGGVAIERYASYVKLFEESVEQEKATRERF